MRKFIIMATSLLFCTSLFGQSKWFKAQSKIATVKSVTATSELVEAQFDGKYLYPPINILDGDFNNTWCEADQKGSGIGESITIEFEAPVSFDEIQIVNGFVCKDYYLKNNRVKTIRLTQVAKEHLQQKDYTLEDNVQDWQSIKFDLLQTAQTITIEIREVYKGTKYDDTCLDDFRLLYKGKVIPFENVENLKVVQAENSKQMLNSNAADFKKQLLSYAKNVDRRFSVGESSDHKYIFLKSEKNNNDKIIRFASSGAFDYIFDCKIMTKQNFIKEKNKESHEDDFFWQQFSYYEREEDKNFDYSKYSYIISYWLPYYEWRRLYDFELGNSRILTKNKVGYVEVTTVTLLKIDGNSIFIDGVKYSVIDPATALDARIDCPE